MRKTYSRYKILGGFGLLFVVNLLIGFTTFTLIMASNVSYDKVQFKGDSGGLVAYSVIVGLNLLCLLLFMTECKFVITNETSITFINPLIPFLKKTRHWTEFDYYILVDEYAQHHTREAVWLIKDQKIKGRFSSFYYTNYQELKDQIKTKKEEKRKFGPFQQVLILLGLKEIRI